MTIDDASKLLERVRAGDPEAQAQVFEQYCQRLIALARSRMSSKLQRRVDPEDVVQSVYRSFFRGADAGRFTTNRQGDLWRLLAGITMNKIAKSVEFHQAQKRTINVENSVRGVTGSISVSFEMVAHSPTPDVAAGIEEELDDLMTSLDPKQREIFELCLQGLENDQIAEECSRSERTVRRILETIRTELEARLVYPT